MEQKANPNEKKLVNSWCREGGGNTCSKSQDFEVRGKHGQRLGLSLYCHCPDSLIILSFILCFSSEVQRTVQNAHEQTCKFRRRQQHAHHLFLTAPVHIVFKMPHAYRNLKDNAWNSVRLNVRAR